MKISYSLVTLGLAALLSACGGGGGSGTPTPSATVSTGVFIDSPVIGIDFTTATQSGRTNAKGEFSYVVGEDITFSIGRVQLPPVAANATVTPLDIAKTTDINNQVVSNILVLLQSLDEDGNPVNGITIPASAAAKATTAIDFNVTPTLFAVNSAVTGLVANSGSVTKTLVAEAAAKAHFQNTLDGTAGTTKVNVAPVANAGTVQSVVTGAVVTLDGSTSSDANNDTLTYAWSLTSKPTGSAAVLTSPTSAKPTFTTDVAGSYVASLVVNDGTVNSTVSTVSVTASTANAAPVANAGAAQNVVAGATVTLNGAASSDANGDALTYAWTLTSKPAGSIATLANATAVAPNFVADKGGSYVATLVVNDGKLNSAAATITVTSAVANVAPVANAGVAQNVVAGSVVTLNGSASSDANDDPLTYAWTLTAKPADSAVALSSATSAKPTFTTDMAGTYVASLTVNDGKINSAVVTVAITVIPVGTQVSGIINTNTLWTLANSPYKVTGNQGVQIAYGANLTIEPGVQIAGGSISVFGKLTAVGSVSSKITFDQVRISQSGTSFANPSAIEIQYARLKGGELIPANGNASYGNLILRDSFIENQGYLYLWYPVSNCYIERNIFKNTGGLSVGVSSVPVYITNNVFAGSTNGYSIQNWASYGGENIFVSKNSFLDVGKVAVMLPGGYSSSAITAINNYWGTTSQSVIQSMIYDKTNDLSSAGYIGFLPFLNQPDALTPIYP